MKCIVILFIILVSCKHPESDSFNRDYNHSIVLLDSTENESTANNIEENQYKVIAIIDGDTYDILKDNISERIRVEGIDAPEKGMPFFKVSKKYLSNMIYEKYVKIVFKKRDRYNRWIGNGYIDDLNISEEMVKAGMAWHFKKYSDNKILSDLEIVARDKKIGLWKDPNPIAPWDIRKLHKSGNSTKSRFENKMEE